MSDSATPVVYGILRNNPDIDYSSYTLGRILNDHGIHLETKQVSNALSVVARNESGRYPGIVRLHRGVYRYTGNADPTTGTQIPKDPETPPGAPETPSEPTPAPVTLHAGTDRPLVLLEVIHTDGDRGRLCLDTDTGEPYWVTRA